LGIYLKGQEKPNVGKRFGGGSEAEHSEFVYRGKA
jgi:hypothetical protein